MFRIEAPTRAMNGVLQEYPEFKYFEDYSENDKLEATERAIEINKFLNILNKALLTLNKNIFDYITLV